jgi:copper(I)-binding protein
MAGLAGCMRPAQATTAPIKLISAYVIQPAGTGITDGYLMIQNSGSADRLLAVSSSAGGRVMLTAPSGQAGQARDIGTLSIPAHSIVRLDPADAHLSFTHSRRVRGGTLITLTLRFARAGTVHVAAEVTNMQSNGGGYSDS